jgi:hypothetical protein
MCIGTFFLDIVDTEEVIYVVQAAVNHGMECIFLKFWMAKYD